MTFPPKNNSLVFCSISRTVVGRGARKDSGHHLKREGIEDLYDLKEERRDGLLSRRGGGRGIRWVESAITVISRC